MKNYIEEKIKEFRDKNYSACFECCDYEELEDWLKQALQDCQKQQQEVIETIKEREKNLFKNMERASSQESFIVKKRENNQIELIWKGNEEILSFLLSEYEALKLYNDLYNGLCKAF